jgi:CRP-like cAMP-binding protein
LFVPRDSIFSVMDGNPGAARRMLGALSARLHRLIMDVETYSLHSGKQRVIGYLLSLAQQQEGPDMISLPTSKRILASRLNLTQEHFSRVLHELSNAGLIVVKGRNFLVPDVEKLRAYAPTR